MKPEWYKPASRGSSGSAEPRQVEEHGRELHVNNRRTNKGGGQEASQVKQERKGKRRRNTALVADIQECTRRQMKGKPKSCLRPVGEVKTGFCLDYLGEKRRGQRLWGRSGVTSKMLLLTAGKLRIWGPSGIIPGPGVAKCQVKGL